MVVKRKALRRFGARWLPLFLWMAVIFIVSDQPSQNVPEFFIWDTVFKKISHFLAYMVMFFLAFRSTYGMNRRFLISFLITFIYAISDEWHQTFVPNRNGNWIDILIDTSGGLTALITLFHWKYQPSRWFQ